MELQDTYLRLDLTLADFLTYLDKTVGKDNYLLFLTADHAGAENAKFLNDHKYNVINIDSKEITKGLRKFSVDTFGDDLVLNYSNFNLFLIKINQGQGITFSFGIQGIQRLSDDARASKRVYTESDILADTGNDYYLNCIAKGYDATQDGDLVILEKPGYIEYGATGTSHGTPYSYDTHVPLLFYGWNIKAGETHDRKVITQIAPTIAQKIKTAFPNGTEAQVLTEILEK